jgi:hypothetical protein
MSSNFTLFSADKQEKNIPTRHDHYILNPNDTAKNFCELYYKNMTYYGFSSNLHLFEYDAKCNFDGKEYVGAQNLLIALCNECISKFHYDNVFCTATLITDKIIMVHAIGSIYSVSFTNINSDTYKFSEIFILKMVSDGKIYVSNHIFKLL